MITQTDAPLLADDAVKVPDYMQYASAQVVSSRFRDLVEEVAPTEHQFVSVTLEWP